MFNRNLIEIALAEKIKTGEKATCAGNSVKRDLQMAGRRRKDS